MGLRCGVARVLAAAVALGVVGCSTSDGDLVDVSPGALCQEIEPTGSMTCTVDGEELPAIFQSHEMCEEALDVIRGACQAGQFQCCSPKVGDFRTCMSVEPCERFATPECEVILLCAYGFEG